MYKILMLSIGTPSKNGERNEVIQRHLDYATSFGGEIHILYFDPKTVLQDFQFENTLFIYNCGAKSILSYPLFTMLKIYGVFKKHRFDVIYTQDPFGTALIGRLVRFFYHLPLIVGNHSSFVNNESWIKEKPLLFSLFNILGKLNIKSANFLKTVSKDEQYIYENQLKVNSSKILVQNTPLKIDQFSTIVNRVATDNLRDSLGFSIDDVILIFVGRPVKVKRIPYLLKIFEKIVSKNCSIKLLIIGNYDQLQEKDEVSSLMEKDNIGSNVVWLKEGIKNELLPLYYQMADIYVHTASYEGLCKTIIEASASGLPVVTTEFSGLSQTLIPDVSGFIVQKDDPDAFVESVLKLADDKELRMKMGDKGRSFIIENFDYEKGINNITQFWHKAIIEYKK